MYVYIKFTDGYFVQSCMVKCLLASGSVGHVRLKYFGYGLIRVDRAVSIS